MPGAMPTLTQNLFRASGHQRLNFDNFVYMYIRSAVLPYVVDAVIIASVYGGWVELLSYFRRLYTKIHEILAHCRGPFVVSTSFPDCLS